MPDIYRVTESWVITDCLGADHYISVPVAEVGNEDIANALSRTLNEDSVAKATLGTKREVNVSKV